MLIAEELLLLCLDDESGKRQLGRESLEPALGGALLVELALRERIGITPHDAGFMKRGRVEIISTVPTDDPELDGVMQHLGRNEGQYGSQKVSALVSDASGKRITKKLSDRVTDRLVREGVLGEERSATLGIRSWPTRNPLPGQEIRQRLQRAMVGGETPTEPTVALIALLDAVSRLTKVVTTGDTRADKKALKARTKELTEGDWAAKAVKDAIAEVASAAAAAAAVAVSAGS